MIVLMASYEFKFNYTNVYFTVLLLRVFLRVSKTLVYQPFFFDKIIKIATLLALFFT